MKICKFALHAVFGFILSLNGASGFAAAVPAVGALMVSAPIDVPVRSNPTTIEHNASAIQTTLVVDAGQR